MASLVEVAKRASSDGKPTTATSSRAVLALNSVITIAANLCKLLFFLALGAAYMIFN